MSLKVKHLSYRQIGLMADQFLSTHHPSLSLPIPIEEIAEAKLNLKIIPAMKIKEQFDVDGCLNSDLTAIFIDYDLYMKYDNRARSTIAHEVGHLILHNDLFQTLNIKTSDDLHRLTEKITAEEYGWLEFQAYSFAGHILVPSKLLFKEIKDKLGKIPNKETPEVLFPVLQDLLDIFQVSGDVMLRRLQKEGIVKSNS